jgi:hypothetical protein
MLRTFLHPTRILPFRRVVAASSFGKARSNLADMLAVCSQISSFSMAETRSKLLTTEDTKKMLVADLKEELKKRGASQQGKKAELLQRLNEILEKENCSPSTGKTSGMSSFNHDVDKRVPIVQFQTEERRNIKNSTVSRQISSAINQTGNDRSVNPSEADFNAEFQKLDLALIQSDPFLFEESMKRMESKIRSNPKLRLSSEEKNVLASKLQAWTEMDSVNSESIACVLTSVGYLGLSIRPTDENRGVAERIIDKYLQAEIVSPSSITSFIWGLYKVGLEWYMIPPKTKSEIETAIFQSITYMNVEEFPNFLKACSSLDKKWYQRKEISESVLRSIFNEGNPLHEKNIHNRLTSYINELTDMGFLWVAAPKNVKLTIFQELEKQIFHPLELSKLFSG